MLIASGVVVSALAGCGDEKVDDAKVEDFVREHWQVPALVRAVDCPDDLELEEGDVFECHVDTARGGRETATIRQVEDERVVLAGSRQVRLPRGEKLVVPEKVEGLIRSRARQPDELVSVDCPPDVKLRQGGRFECVVRFTYGRPEAVEVVQVDALGNVKIARGRR